LIQTNPDLRNAGEKREKCGRNAVENAGEKCGRKYGGNAGENAGENAGKLQTDRFIVNLSTENLKNWIFRKSVVERKKRRKKLKIQINEFKY
jgi:hypothetical protein